jgi:hypothetical protein
VVSTVPTQDKDPRGGGRRSRHGRNAYTDAQPRFPYESRFVQYELGLPAFAELHLAITDLADRLLALDVSGGQGLEDRLISALRVALRTVINFRPFEYAAAVYCDYVDASAEVRAYWQAQAQANGPRVDWLRQAVDRLRSEGWTGTPGMRRLR